MHAIFNRQGSKEHNVKEEKRLQVTDIKEIRSEKCYEMVGLSLKTQESAADWQATMYRWCFVQIFYFYLFERVRIIWMQIIQMNFVRKHTSKVSEGEFLWKSNKKQSQLWPFISQFWVYISQLMFLNSERKN